MFLSKISTHNVRVIIHYIVEENVFVVKEEILKRHLKDCFKIDGKQRIVMPKKGEYVKFKNLEKKKKNHHS